MISSPAMVEEVEDVQDDVDLKALSMSDLMIVDLFHDYTNYVVEVVVGQLDAVADINRFHVLLLVYLYECLDVVDDATILEEEEVAAAAEVEEVRMIATLLFLAEHCEGS